MIDIKEIRRLKDLTGVGLTEAKKALEESGGDFDEALKAMRAKGLTKAEKRGEREARAGLVGSYNHDGRIGVVVEVNCETDFVARNEIFSELVKDLAMHIAASDPQYLDDTAVPEPERQRIHQEFTAKAENEGRDTNKIEQIVAGQEKKYFAERTLLSQPFIKDPAKTVGDLVREHNARLGENIVVRRYYRLALGELD